MKIRKMRKRVRASKRISFHAELHSLRELSFKLLTTLMSYDDKMLAVFNALDGLQHSREPGARI